MRGEAPADWVSVAEAREAILSSIRTLPSQRRSLSASLGHVLAEDVTSPVDLPPWDNSAMDGFAARANDVLGATPEEPRILRLLEDVAAGAFPTLPLEPGTATRVMTGAPVPEGADGVIRVEHTDRGHGLGTETGRVAIFSDTDAGRNIRRRGEDVSKGAPVLAAGTVLRAAELGVAASLGRSQLTVVRRPVVAILASGDELVDVDGFAEVLAGRKIVSSNSHALAAQLAESGMEARVLGIAADDPASLREHLERARGCDALITSAGVSVGEHDYTREVLAELGARTAFWRVRMKPGSPFAFGHVGALGDVPWFGLPGNPVSSMVTFELFVRPALLRMAGHSAVFPPTVSAVLADGHGAGGSLTHFVRVRLREHGGELTAHLTGSQGSGILTSMAAADGLLVIPEGRAGTAGDSFPTVVFGGAPLRPVPGY